MSRFRAAVCALVMMTVVAGGVGNDLLSHRAEATTVPVGVYTGPANVAGMDSFSTSLGAPAPYATDFADYTKTWNDVANPMWLLDPWSTWVKAVPGRRLVLGVPLLINANRGQLAQGASGAFDASFRTLAQNMVARGLGTSVIRLGWEMNNSSFPWYAGTDPASYKSFYARAVGVMRSVPGAAFSFDWNPNAGVQGGSPLTTFASFYPGDAYVDVIGLDRYDIKWMDSTSTPEQRWNWMLTQPLGLNDHKAFATAHAKPLSFPEWGLYRVGDQQGGGGDNPYYIDRMADWFAATNTAYHSYFNADWGGGTLANFPNGQARYKARFGASAISIPTAPAPTTTTIAAPSSSDTTAPSAPTGLVATASKHYVVLTFAGSADSGGSGLVGYEVYRSTWGGPFTQVGTTTSVAYTDAGLYRRTGYAYYVKAYDAAGNRSAASTAVTIRTR